MEKLRRRFLEGLTSVYLQDGYGSGSGNGYGYGSGYGYGDGHGNDDGYGNGYGSGDGHGSGNGYGDDDGYGNGDDDGTGNCYGSGDGYGTGNGDGYGDGDGISHYNGSKVSYIDDIATIITSVRGDVAKGMILHKNLTTTPCYVAKSGMLFAHGKTLREACEALETKILSKMSVEDKVAEFKKVFEKGKRYSARLFYKWHGRLTGSCQMGRDSWVKNNGIDLDSDMFTVEEFVDRTKDSYGGEIIRRLV